MTLPGMPQRFGQPPDHQPLPRRGNRMTIKGFVKAVLKGLAVTVGLVVAFGVLLFNCVGTSEEPTGRHAALLADPMANIEQLPGVEYVRRTSSGDGEVLGKPVIAEVHTFFVAVDEKSVRLAADAALALAEEAGWVLPEDGAWEQGYSLVKQIESQDVNLSIRIDQYPEEWSLTLWLQYRR